MRAVQARANQVYRPACCKQVPPPFPWPGNKKSKDTGKSTRGWNACVHTWPRFILLCKRVLGKWSQNPCQLQGKISPLPEKFSSEEDRTHDAASSRAVSQTYYQRAIPAPELFSNQFPSLQGNGHQSFYISYTTPNLIEGQGHPNWYQNVELGGLYHHTKFERSQSVNVSIQANIKMFLTNSYK